MESQHKFNNLIYKNMTINNTLAQSIIDADYSTMNYSQLLALSYSITRAQGMISSNMEKKRKEEMTKIKEGYLVAMKSYGATIEEITEFDNLELDNEFDFSTNNEVEEPVISVSSSEDVEDTTCEVEVDTTLALPAHSPEDTEEKMENQENTESIKETSNVQNDDKTETTKSVFDSPALKQPYKPNKETLPSMKELLSDDERYNTPSKKEHGKKHKKKLQDMEELLSDDPVNRILCMGNMNPPNAPYKQHSRICDVEGISPTLMATGDTYIMV